MASTISQISCFSSISRSLHLHRRSLPCHVLRPKFGIVMNLKGPGTGTSSSDIKTTLSYKSESPNLHVEGISKPYPLAEEHTAEETGRSETIVENSITQQTKGAKIHDFCFGIPFGGLVLIGGLIGFLFTRNLTNLGTDVIFGSALLALSTVSLKIWKQGKSSLPYILGQAVLAGALLWKNIQAYSVAKNLFPTGIYMVISAAMLSFYSYVIASGGNPPPKKKPSASVSS